jgi:hypothetical protein
LGAVPGRGVDLRHEERIEVALPVRFAGGATGTTLNVSATGVCIDTDCNICLGMPVTLVIEFTNQPGGPLRVTCEANILRVAENKQGRRIAAALRWIGQE